MLSKARPAHCTFPIASGMPLRPHDSHSQGPDPVLTPLGESQARSANTGWKVQIKDGVPLPQALYSSPLRRAAHTLEITWSDILLNRGLRPVVSAEHAEQAEGASRGSWQSVEWRLLRCQGAEPSRTPTERL